MNVRTVRNASGLAREIIRTIRHAACRLQQCGVSHRRLGRGKVCVSAAKSVRLWRSPLPSLRFWVDSES